MRDFTIDIIWIKLQIAICAIGGWLGCFLGNLDGLMIALVILMILDYITGIICAILDRTLSSAVGFKGICRKALILLIVGLAHIVDLHGIGSGEVLRSAVICFYLSNEGVSILENTAHLGLPILKRLKLTLAQLHDRSDEGVNDNEYSHDSD